MPPTAVITHVVKQPGGRLLVRGTTADNGEIKAVIVNGQKARAIVPNFGKWEIELESGEKSISAHAEDSAGNVESRPHRVLIR